MISVRAGAPHVTSQSATSALRPLAFVTVMCGASQLVAGASCGFSALSAHLAFWCLATLLALSAFMIADRLFPSAHVSDFAIRAGLVAFGVVVACGLVLGAVRLLTGAWFAMAEVLIAITMLLVEPRWAAGAVAARVAVPPVILGIWAALLAFVIGMGLGHAPFTLYDSLSYHLFFPARWLQAHRLSIIPTPFSDEAQAYQPGNGELWFLWLMFPFHGDFLARIGQLPFYGLGATAVYALARRLGATSRQALYAPTFFLIAPPVVEQAVGANVDLIHAALFVTTLYLGVAALKTDTPADWTLWGVALGLWLGTKYLALVYLPIFLALAVIRGPRVRTLWALPGVLVFAAPWYLRNWIVAGSPIYPVTLSVAGLTIGQGAYTHNATTQSFLHSTDLRLLGVSLAHACGTTLFLFLLPASVLVVVAVLVRKAWWPAGFVLLATAAGVVLVWLGVGDNADSRFLLPAVVTSFSVLPLAFGLHRRVDMLIHAFYFVGFAWMLIGANTNLSTASLPWFMSDWLSLHGIVTPQFLLLFAGLAAVAVGVCAAAHRAWRVPAAVALASAAGVALAIGGETWCVPSRCDFLQVASPHLRTNFLYASRWLDANVGPANVAYTGINLPYPLSGSHLTRVVSYVNIDRHPDWRFDQYARGFRRGAIGRPEHPLLASASGLLMPAVRHGEAVDALRPRFERLSGDPDAWLANLERAAVSYVFISTLDPYDRLRAARRTRFSNRGRAFRTADVLVGSHIPVGHERDVSAGEA